MSTALRSAVTRSMLIGYVVIGSALLGGCGFGFGGSQASKVLNPDPPGEMFATADGLLTSGKYVRAAKKFESVDRDYPYAPEARRAIVMAAYAYYKDGKYPEARAQARRYATLHPGTKEAALAHHIIASSYFDQIKGPTRDQTATRKALKELKELQARYPNSKYAEQAGNRIRLAEDMLAAADMNVGRYYLKKRNYLAAINRFKHVVIEYQTTKHVEEALMRLTEAYMALGIRNEAQTAAAVLGHNFPNSPWYKDAYTLLASNGLEPRNNGSSWISRAWKKTVNVLSFK